MQVPRSSPAVTAGYPMRLLMLPVALLLSACATTMAPPPVPQPRPIETPAPAPTTAPVSSAEEQGLRTLVALQDRLYRVAAPLLVNNAELCKNAARNLLGFTAKNQYSYSTEYMNAARSTLGLGERLQVMGVLDGSGAARAGVQRGDVLIAIDDRPLPSGENAERQAAALVAPLVSARTATSAVRLTVERNGLTLPINVPLTFACGFGIELGNTDNVTAYADGYRVLVTRGMMNTVQSDDELAYVMAKEMAHNILAHPSRRRISATLGGIIDNLSRIRPDMSTMVGLSGVKPMPREMDAMADKLALYMLARANYNIEQVIPFWQKLASQYPPTVLNAYTAMHPATAFRITAMEKALRDIRVKQAANRPLRP